MFCRDVDYVSAFAVVAQVNIDLWDSGWQGAIVENCTYAIQNLDAFYRIACDAACSACRVRIDADSC